MRLNVIQRAAGKFDKLIVAIGENPAKVAPVFSLEERVQFFKVITANISNIEIVAFNRLLVDFAKSQGVDIII